VDQDSTTTPEEKDTLLEILAELSQRFADSADLSVSLQSAVSQSMQYLSAEAGSLFLISEDGSELECVASGGPVDITGLRMSASEGIVGQVAQQQHCALIRDTRLEPGFSARVDHETGFETRSILCAPLAVRGELLGVLELLNKRSGSGLFNEADCHFLSVVSAGVALALKNARHTMEMVEKERIRHELSLARTIQSSLLPPPQEPTCGYHGINIPAHEVSGDFFSFQPLDGDTDLFALGDVAGKGVHAALLMSRITTLIHAYGATTPDPALLMARLNEEVMAAAPRGIFITLALGIHHRPTDTVRLTNAGHLPPLLRDAKGGYTEWPATSPPLGVLRGVEFPEYRFPLGSNALYFCSDGLTEALSATRTTTGLNELKACIDRFAWILPDQRIRAIVNEAMTGTRKDDITLLCVDGIANQARLIATKTVTAQPQQLATLRHHAASVFHDLAMAESQLERLVLALGEAAMNIVQHGFSGGSDDGRLDLEIYLRPDGVSLRLLDNAFLFRPSGSIPKPAGKLRPGGLGLSLIREIMDEVIYLPRMGAEGNLLEMFKRAIP